MTNKPREQAPKMEKKIECYIDIGWRKPPNTNRKPTRTDPFISKASAYSYFAFSYLQDNASALAQLGVTIESVSLPVPYYSLSPPNATQLTPHSYHPVFLGGINVATSNSPPWTVPAKAAYGAYDISRAQRHFNAPYTRPPIFPILSLLPQRALIHCRQRYAKATFEKVLEALLRAYWVQQLDISQPEILTQTLRTVLVDPGEAESVVRAAGTAEVKEALRAETERVVKELGAFGCPWFWVSNGGKGEPFFGSDRFHYMWEFLRLPYRGLELVVPAKL